ncbi:MAG: M13 family metallopeptidase, partial [Candidatus Eisenbacteria bacterium]
MNRKLAAALAVMLVAGCSRSTTREPSATAENYLAAFIDPAVDPRQDFFRYSVGKWLAENPIPVSERSWGISKVVQEETYRRLVLLSDAAAADRNAAAGSNAQKIGDFWHAAMDSAAIETAGIQPLADEFAMIDAAADRDALLDVIAKLQHLGVGALFSTYIFQDEKNSERYALHLYQGGLGLPSREYYFDTDERTTKVRSEYVPHVTRMFELLGDDSSRARANAGTVMAIETDLARSSRKLEDMRDPHKNYNAMPLSGVARLTPSIRWREFLEQGSIRGVDTVIVGQPEFFRQVEKQLRARSVDEWKTYLRWHVLTAFAENAGGRFDAENFRFYGTILNGTAEQRPRWKRMLDSQENYLGYALGQLYVERYFSPHTKERYERVTTAIFDAFRERLNRLEWMSAATKERALRKLDAVTRKIGYPERWRDYSTYEVNRESFLGNVKRGNGWLSDFYIAKLGKPVDRTEWEMTPQTYNAYYNPSNNEIVMPAAIFILPGIADSLADDALVYGYAGGTTVGHEITHGFDDTGRQFDERGNLVSWWTAEDEKEFNRRAERIIRQYDAYVAVDSLHVNGAATQGENIADLGGIELGWDAFTRTQQYKEGKPLGGLTPAQRYFIGWSLGWMNQLRPENLALRVKTDVHAPSFLRVIGPVTNLPQFYEAFAVQPGDPM